VAAAMKSGLQALNYVDLAKVKVSGKVSLDRKSLTDADMPIVAAMLTHPESKFTDLDMSKLFNDLGFPIGSQFGIVH
jgi:hypothetical protein